MVSIVLFVFRRVRCRVYFSIRVSLRLVVDNGNISPAPLAKFDLLDATNLSTPTTTRPKTNRKHACPRHTLYPFDHRAISADVETLARHSANSVSVSVVVGNVGVNMIALCDDGKGTFTVCIT